MMIVVVWFIYVLFSMLFGYSSICSMVVFLISLINWFGFMLGCVLLWLMVLCRCMCIVVNKLVKCVSIWVLSLVFVVILVIRLGNVVCIIGVVNIL